MALRAPGLKSSTHPAPGKVTSFSLGMQRLLLLPDTVAITGTGDGYFAGDEVIVWNLRTEGIQQTLAAPYPVGALCCDSGRGVAIGTGTEIVALQHERSRVHRGPVQAPGGPRK